MHTVHTIIIGAFTLGFIGGAIPGPVLTGILAEIMESGFRSSMRVLFFALCTETCVRLVALMLAGVLLMDGKVFHALSVVGALILLRIAIRVWSMKNVESSGTCFSLQALAGLIVCNGMLWTYWLTVCVPDAIRLGTMIPFGQYAYLFVFECGWLLSTFGMACVFASMRPLLSHPRVMPFLFKSFAVVFAIFGLKMLAGSLRVLLG